jgi:hypothetical protein
MFLYNFLNGKVNCAELFLMIGFQSSQFNLRVNKLFYDLFFTNNYGSTSFLPRFPLLANKIANFVDIS